MTVWNFPSQIVLKNSKTIHALETDSHCNKSFINLIQKWDTKMYPNVFTMERLFLACTFLRHIYYHTKYLDDLVCSGISNASKSYCMIA